MIAVTQKLSWYVSRASGLIAWALVAAAIVWGVTLSSRLVRRRGIPAWLLDLHRYLGTLALVFTVVHLIGLVADNFVYFGWKELFVPMGTKWNPGATAWGIVAFYMLIAVQITSWMMRKMPRKIWHSVHLLSFPLFIAGTIHGFQSGADADNKIVQWVALGVIVLVVGLTTFRALTFTPRKKRGGAGKSSKGTSTPAAADATAAPATATH